MLCLDKQASLPSGDGRDLVKGLGVEKGLRRRLLTAVVFFVAVWHGCSCDATR